MTRNRHDTYAKGMAQIVAGPEVRLRTELHRPISATSVDTMMDLDDVPAPYQAFADELGHRAVDMEFYSMPPALDDVMGCVHKAHENLRLEMNAPERASARQRC